jgi:hypothetical protein
MSWSDDGKGKCMSIKFGNGSQFSKRECGEKLNYICEVTDSFLYFIIRTVVTIFLGSEYWNICRDFARRMYGRLECFNQYEITIV